MRACCPSPAPGEGLPDQTHRRDHSPSASSDPHPCSPPLTGDGPWYARADFSLSGLIVIGSPSASAEGDHAPPRQALGTPGPPRLPHYSATQIVAQPANGNQ